MVTPQEAQVLEELSLEDLWRHTKTIAQWVRLSGSPEERRAFDYLTEVLEGYGARVKTYEFDSLVGYPGKASFEVLTPQPASFPCITHALAPSTGEEGTEGELIYVGQGREAAYQGRDARGSIALIDGYGLPMAARARIAEGKGALGQVFVHDDHLHEMCLSTIWGTPTPETAPLLPRTPAVSVARGHAAYLKELLQQGPVRVRIRTESWSGWRKLPVLVADLPGAREPERFVLLSCHVDSWHYGAMDNASGNATALEVARVLSRHPPLLRRSLRLAFWSGHSHGRYSGSTWYADSFWEDLHQSCVAHINIDSPGGRGATYLTRTLTMPETRSLAAQVIRELTGQRLEARGFSRAGDQSFWGCGVPSLFMSLSEQPGWGLGWWWHTADDTLDKLDGENLRRDARVYALAVLRLCSSALLPLDYVPLAEEFLEVLAKLQGAAKRLFDLEPCLEKAQDFKAKALALREALHHLASRSQEEGDSADEDCLRLANETLMGLGRLLIPIFYTGVSPFDHELAAPVPRLPLLQPVAALASLDPGSYEFHFLRTRLVRERNKVCHALTEASDLAQGALRSLASHLQGVT